MKYFVLTLAMLFTCMNANASNIALVLSPHQTKAEGDAQFRQTYTLFQQLPLGSQLRVLNGDNAHLIATLAIPDKDVYQHEAIRAKHNAQGLRALKGFFENMRQGHRTTGAINAPEVITEIVRHSPSVTDILIFGSALYDNPSHPALDMSSGAYPSDDFILAPPSVSVFGTKDVTSLNGKRIHWVLPTSFENTLFGEAVLRFYHLYINALGGELVSFTANQDAVIQRLLQRAEALPMRHTLNPRGKLEMLTLSQASVNTHVQTQSVTHAFIPVQTISSARPLVLGIEWENVSPNEVVDLDIYARPAGGEALYFGHKTSTEGVHVKDMRTGDNNNTRFYERIEFHAPLDIDALRIAVNLYDAPTLNRSVSGTLRLSMDDVIYQMPFHFELSQGGNQGADIRQALNNGNNTAFSRFFTVNDIIAASQEGQ